MDVRLASAKAVSCVDPVASTPRYSSRPPRRTSMNGRPWETRAGASSLWAHISASSILWCHRMLNCASTWVSTGSTTR
jgi:hypothetical protein